MAIKVGLSYYMEGEHSQGAKASWGVGLEDPKGRWGAE